MNTRTRKLLQLMSDHRLKSPEVAAMLNRNPQTVRLWRSNVGRTIPADALELLEIKLSRSV